VPLTISSTLRWLFIDLNSYFASVEQQLHPELRGRPVAVVPVLSDSTCAIAASREAKRFGIKTGTNIGDAKRLCRDLVLVEAHHNAYVEYHHRIRDEIERHYPVHVIGSIDEVGCLLDNRHANEAAALALARRIKRGLREQVGEVITCSAGIAPNRYLAKTASDLTKPDGLEIVRLEDLPGRLAHLKLTDLCGIGRNMEPRLHQAGIHDFLGLWEARPETLRRVWGGVGGERFWHQLHGGDLDDEPTTRRTVGHSHVLAPEFRNPPEAGIVARRLLLKAASRMRRLGYRATALQLAIRLENRLRGEAQQRFPALSDSHALLGLLAGLWERLLDPAGRQRVLKIAVTLHGLEPADAPEQLDLFPSLGLTVTADRGRRERLSQVLDDINQKFGRDSLALGFLPDAVKTFSGTKIAVTRIPDASEFHE